MILKILNIQYKRRTAEEEYMELLGRETVNDVAEESQEGEEGEKASETPKPGLKLTNFTEIKINLKNFQNKNQDSVTPAEAIKPATDADGNEIPPETAESKVPRTVRLKLNTNESQSTFIFNFIFQFLRIKKKRVMKNILKTYLFMYYNSYPSDMSSKMSVFFIRTTPGTVPVPNSINEARQTLPQYFDFGLLNAHPLFLLSQMLNKVYAPLLSHRGMDEEPKPSRLAVKDVDQSGGQTKQKVDKVQDEKDARKRVNDTKNRSTLRNEFLITMQKFINHIDLTIRQIEGEVRLNVPKTDLPSSLHGIEKDEALITSLENVAYEWESTISDALEVQNRRTPKGDGPLAEIDYWKERNISLSGIFEQTKQEKVRRILEILQHVESPAFSSFESQRQDLARFYSEAKDNVRFLSTLERHFKNVCYGATFHVVSETIPSMMNALRMIWIISRHYNKDERMVPLMERIAFELSDRVAKVINIKTILE
jgi:dynein heavy chain